MFSILTFILAFIPRRLIRSPSLSASQALPLSLSASLCPGASLWPCACRCRLFISSVVCGPSCCGPCSSVPGRVQHAVPAYYNYLLLPRACLLGLLGLLELLGLVPLGVSLGDFALQLVARERGRREGRRVSVGASGIRAETSRIRAGARQSAATVLDRAICRDYVRQGQGPCACTLTAHVP